MIAYLSIGEAETYRPYWNKAWKKEPPPWLGKENREWRGNYGVKFWEPGWQAIIFDYADRIVAAGFDGIYLDKVDEFEDMGHPDEMVDFVAAHRRAGEGEEPGIPGDLAERRRPAAEARSSATSSMRSRARICSSARTTTASRTSRTASRTASRGCGRLPARRSRCSWSNIPRTSKQAEQARADIAALGFIGHTTDRDLEKI